MHFKVTDKEELDEKQKIIESLNLQLRDKDKEIDKLKRSLRGNLIKLILCDYCLDINKTLIEKSSDNCFGRY